MKIGKRILALLLTVSVLFGLAVTVNATTTVNLDGVTYKEAMEVACYLDGFDTSKSLRPTDGLSVFDAEKLLSVIGVETNFTVSDVVTGDAFIDLILPKLELDAADLEGYKSYVKNTYLLLGMKSFDASNPISREEAAQVLMNALKVKKQGTGIYLFEDTNIAHRVDGDFNEPFNRPGSYWIEKDHEDHHVTATYVATPVLVSGEYITWCQVQRRLGFTEQDHRLNFMKWFNNTTNGGAFTGYFNKCHWGENHGGCGGGDQYVNSNGQTMEIYEMGTMHEAGADSGPEYRNVMISNFLGRVDDKGLTLYAWNRETWGPWNAAGLPAHGYYIVNYHWNSVGHTNANGAADGFVIVQEADTVYGQLDGMEAPFKIWINGVMNIASANYNLGYDEVFGTRCMDNYNNHRKLTYFVDQYGLPIGNLEPSEDTLTESCSHEWVYSLVGDSQHVAFCAKCKGTKTESCTMQVAESKDASCSEKGYTIKVCICGRTERSETSLDSTKHAENSFFEDPVEATPTEAGHTGREFCKDCGKLLNESTLIAAHAHSYDETWEKDETQHWKKCTFENCTKTEECDDHTWDEGIEIDGKPNKLLQTCTVCGQTQEVPAKNDNQIILLPFMFGSGFADVDAMDWYSEAVDYVFSNGYMNGVSFNSFAPNAALTRGMLVTILHRMNNYDIAASAGFSDVKDDAYYKNAVDWAAANGLVNGIGNSKFAPDAPVSREQLAAILYRYSEYLGRYTVPGGKLNSFDDFNKVSSYATDALRWAVSEGLINGIGSKLAPQATATRAQFAAILMRFMR